MKALRHLERTLLAIGLGLGAWCATVMLQARIVAEMPIPIVLPAPTTGSWVARLDAPAVRLSATVLEGSDDATLARAAGHIERTAFPGQDGNVGIAGHRDTTFRAVRDLHTGDALELTTSDRIYRYVITKTLIVDPKDVFVLAPGDQPMLTLVTCYPFTFIGRAPHRFIIQAVLVDQAARTPAGVAGGAGP